ncbi:MAG: hypothetical protein EP329_11895 [Deltaproteobacteria bacterium]|nr:MAG: hypothetical protein EP329_11895 [Deltaproteobacteria bacterium]
MAQHLLAENHGGVLQLTLNRPDVRNAFNDELIIELRDAFVAAADDAAVRCVVLAGAGKVFCAGADLAWMKSTATSGEAANAEGARRLAGLFEAVDRCPKPVIARVHGAAMGGGVGLVACCDVVVATAPTFFAFSEVRLGLAPAVISPYVVRKIGVGAARELFVTGERFDAERACAIGLVSHVAADEAALDARVASLAKAILSGAPGAVAACKELAMTVGDLDRETAAAETAALIARLRAGAEGQEGMRAFLTRTPPAWTVQDGGDDA